MKKSKINVLTNIIVVVLLFSALTDISAKKKPKFSGEWKFNVEESEVSPQMSFAPSSISITQSKKEIKIVRKVNIQGENSTISENLMLDGSDSQSEGPMNSTMISNASWSDDKSSLVVVSKIQTDFGEFENKLIYTLEDGKLKIQSLFTTNEGDMSETWVYDTE